MMQVTNMQYCCRCSNPNGICWHTGPCSLCERHKAPVTTAPTVSLPSQWQGYSTEKTPFLKIQKVENGYIVTHDGKEYVFESLIGIAYHFEPPIHQTEEG